MSVFSPEVKKEGAPFEDDGALDADLATGGAAASIILHLWDRHQAELVCGGQHPNGAEGGLKPQILLSPLIEWHYKANTLQITRAFRVPIGMRSTRSVFQQCAA